MSGQEFEVLGRRDYPVNAPGCEFPPPNRAGVKPAGKTQAGKGTGRSKPYYETDTRTKSYLAMKKRPRPIRDTTKKEIRALQVQNGALRVPPTQVNRHLYRHEAL